MSRAAEQPTAEQARQARDCVLAEAAAAGKRPSVLTVARRSGLSNTTFRRHFPDIARELSEARRTPPADITSSPAAADHARLVARNARLRRDNQQLRQHLQLASAKHPAPHPRSPPAPHPARSSHQRHQDRHRILHRGPDAGRTVGKWARKERTLPPIGRV